MNTLSGLASKGEKGKSKYQSLDINSLYRSSRGESVETHQQKSTAPRKHGMQSLGKVPSARRPPANLPSLKSEHSGSDAAVSLVPSGGPGWGKQDSPSSTATSTSPSTTTPSSVVTTVATTVSTTAPTVSAHQAAIALPVSSPVANKSPVQPSSVVQPAATVDKSWSSVMAGADLLGHPPPYQSPQFQHEFPSLSAADGGGGTAASTTQRGGPTDVQYGPGPSLRPQTEGSWMQGGSRSNSGVAQAVETGQGTAKGNSGQLVGPPQLLVPAGHNTAMSQPHQHMQPPPPQFRGLLPPFMCRGNFPANGHGSSNFQSVTNPLNGRGRFPGPGSQGQILPESRVPIRSGPPVEVEDLTHRPIIKEEDLNRMDDMTRDVGWASHDDIDYNQKLAFSDDELPSDREKDNIQKDSQTQKKEMEKIELASDNRGSSMQNRNWNVGRSGSQPPIPQTGRSQNLRRVEDDEVWEQRRRQQCEEVAIAVERAKLRKEEEEKRYLESKQAAAKKLQELEEKMKEKKGVENRENEETQGTINPSTVPPQPITPVPIPVPDWEREREIRERERSRTPNDTIDNKQQHMQQQQAHRDADFRQLTQIESRNFINKAGNNRGSEREISRDRDCRERDRDVRERDGPNFSRQFQSNLPPRFQKQQAERQNNVAPPYHRNGNSGSPQPPQSNASTTNVPFAQQYDPRWVQSSSSFSKNSVNTGVRNNMRKEDNLFERDREDDRSSNRDIRRDRHTPDADRDRPYSDSGRRISGEGRNYDDYNTNYRRESSQEYEYKKERDDDKWEKDRHYDDRKDDKKSLQVQQDPFDVHEMNRQDSGEWRREKYSKEGSEERNQDRHRESDMTQRPDSRDSRISKESLRDCSDYTGNWADSPFEPTFIEEKKKDTYREERRIVPGPITKEKIEADDLKNEKRHLTQLKRSSNLDKLDKKVEDKVPEKKVDDAWVVKKKEPEHNENASSPKTWADSTSPTTAAAPEHKFMEALEKGHKKSQSGDSLHKEMKQDVKKIDKEVEANKEKEEKQPQSSGSRGRNDGRSNHRPGWSSGYSVHPNWSKRGEGRGNRGSQRSGGHRAQIFRGGDWHMNTDSDLSGDEISVSTESGKEDRSTRLNLSQRSPKPIKKSEKDEKNKEAKQDKNITSDRDRKFEKRSYEHNTRSQDNYVPRGEPSRHGRGGFRGSRSMLSSKRIDGYGIPPSKSPFGNKQEDKDKKLSGDEIGGEVISSDEKTKFNQQALSAGIIGSARTQVKNDNVGVVRSQRKSESEKRDRSRGRAHSGSRRQKSKTNKAHSSDAGEECWETTSENSDTENERKDKGKRKQGKSCFAQNTSSRQSNVVSSNNTVNINSTQNNRNLGSQSNKVAGGDKRSGSFAGRVDNQHSNMRQNSSSSLRSNQSVGQKSVSKESAGKPEDTKGDFGNNMVDINKKDTKVERPDSVENVNVQEDVNSEEKPSFDDGFQEVRSKKNVKERQKVDEKVTSRQNIKTEKESVPRGPKYKSNSPAMQLTPQQIANIPSLLGTPINPPAMMTTGNKSTFERPRQNKLAPRFAKQRENRMQKVQMQGMCDVNEMNKINQNVTMYGIKDGIASGSVPVNAWDKPITSQLRGSVETDALLTMSVETCTDLEQTQPSSTSSQRSSPNNDKMLGKVGQVQDKAILDGTTPPVNTIIFENTNYKSAPVNANADLAVKAKFNTHIKSQQRPEKPRGNKLEDGDMDNSVMSGFNKPISDILNKGDSKPEPIQMPLSFNKAEDNADMKLDFTFDSDLSQLTEDKGSKSLGLPRSMHAMTSAQSTISPSTADLNFKIASVKKVWETMPTVLEHTVGQEDNVANNATSFATSFGPDPNALDHSAAFSKTTDPPDDNHEGYSPSPNQSCTSNNTTNVCKVKPTQQLAGAGQAVHSVSSHHTGSQQHPGATSQHSAMVGQNLIGHPLSPPPMQQVLGAGVSLGQPSQQYTSNQHMNYQPSLGGSAQYGGMSTIPSPPTVLFNSTQQMPTQGGLYGPFQIDQSQVMNTQGRSQYSQYPGPYGLGQTASSPYSAQSMYLQTAPPHPPPSAQPPPDIYQNLTSQYRMAATGPFGQSQQLTNNPSTVLISSTSNSLMSATVKPSTQQISAIGTKAGTVGQAYQQQSQQGQQVYIPYDPNLQANYLSSTGVLQRGPTGPVQNNVVPGLQPSSSYYSGSAGAQTGFYQQPGNSTLQSAQLHQTSYGLQNNMFGTHNQSHASAGLQSFGSQYLSSPLQMAAAAALTAQQPQYRSPNLPNPNYLKGVGNQHITDQSGRSQQLKSPGANQQDVLASVFNSGSQIPSPKSRQNCKQPPPQSSPTQHKYVSPYQTNSQQSAQIPATRYPTPIQRPVNFQPTLNSSLQGSGNVGQRHRPTHNQNSRGPQQRQYYGGQGGGLQSSQSEKTDESKLIENGSSVTISATNTSAISSSNGVSKSAVGNNSAGQGSDLTKDSATKDEAIVNKE